MLDYLSAVTIHFIDYTNSLLKPLTAFMHLHPNIAGFIAFFIAFIESLAIIGTIFPGSATMMPIGIMLGTSVLPLGRTLIFIFTGAFLGDYLSYWVGVRYQYKLRTIKFMQKYQGWLKSTEDWMRNHGMSAIIIGRMVGPMRSSIPLVAGLMNMPRTKFILAAIPSVIIWAITYLAPGFLLGAFSLEFSHEKAMKFIISALLCISIPYFLRKRKKIYNWLWVKLRSTRIQYLITEGMQFNGYIDALLLIILSSIFIHQVMHSTGIVNLNQPIFYLLQSTHTEILNQAAILISILGDTYTMGSVIGLCLLYLGIKRQWQQAIYMILTSLFGVGVLSILRIIIHSPRPELVQGLLTDSSCPSGHVGIITIIMFIFYYLYPGKESTLKNKAWYFLPILMMVWSRIYLGAHWFSDTFIGLLVGSAIGFIFASLYHRFYCVDYQSEESTSSIRVLVIILISTWLVTIPFQLQRPRYNFTTYVTQTNIKTISINTWRNQNPLPFERLNRLHRPTTAFNMQWIGSIEEINKIMLDDGWEQHQPVENILDRIYHWRTEPSLRIMPLIPQLYLKQTAGIIFSKKLDEQNDLTLKLWKSSYKTEAGQTIWLGSIYETAIPQKFFSTKKWLKSQQRFNTTEQLNKNLPTNSGKHLFNTISVKTISAESISKLLNSLDWDGQILLIETKKK